MPILLTRVRRIETRIHRSAPMVRMTEYMAKDVLKWLMLLVILVASFAAATFKVYLGLDFPNTDDCREFEDSVKQNVLYTALHLFEIAIGVSADDDFKCTPLSSIDFEMNALAIASRVLNIMWLIVSIALAMNMLIAMMAKSFDNVWTKHLTHVRMVFAQSTLAWQSQAPTPPPISMLSVPYQLWIFAAWVLAKCAESVDGHGHVKLRDENEKGGAETLKRVLRTSSEARVSSVHEYVERYVATRGQDASSMDSFDQGIDTTGQSEFRVEVRTKLLELDKKIDSLAQRFSEEQSSVVESVEKQHKEQKESAEKQHRELVEQLLKLVPKAGSSGVVQHGEPQLQRAPSGSDGPAAAAQREVEEESLQQV